MPTSFAITTEGLRRPVAFIGILGAVQGLGAVGGGFSAAPLVRRLGEGRLVGVAMLVAAAGVALTILPLLLPVIAGIIVFGAALPWLVVGLITLAQRLTPPQLQGRVYAAAEVLVTTPQTVSIAVGASLIAVVDYQVLLAVMAAVFAVTAACLLTRPEQRRAGMPSAQARAEGAARAPAP